MFFISLQTHHSRGPKLGQILDSLDLCHLQATLLNEFSIVMFKATGALENKKKMGTRQYTMSVYMLSL